MGPSMPKRLKAQPPCPSPNPFAINHLPLPLARARSLFRVWLPMVGGRPLARPYALIRLVFTPQPGIYAPCV